MTAAKTAEHLSGLVEALAADDPELLGRLANLVVHLMARNGCDVSWSWKPAQEIRADSRRPHAGTPAGDADERGDADGDAECGPVQPQGLVDALIGVGRAVVEDTRRRLAAGAAELRTAHTEARRRVGEMDHQPRHDSSVHIHTPRVGDLADVPDGLDRARARRNRASGEVQR